MQPKQAAPLHTPRMRRLSPGLWVVESKTTKGLGHQCTVGACSCPAGKFKKMCSHRRLVRQAEAWLGAYDAQGASTPVPPAPAPVPQAPAVAGDWHSSAAYRALADCFE